MLMSSFIMRAGLTQPQIDAVQWPELVFELGRHQHRKRPIQVCQGCQLQLEDVRVSIRSTVDIFEPGREIG